MNGVKNNSDKVSEIINNLRRVFQVVNEQSKKSERRTGLTGPQLWAIKIIAQESPIMVSEVARRMYLHPATVVGILDRLEKQGLAARIRSTEDRRVVRVKLTRLGRALIKRAPEVAQGLLVTGLERLGVKKLKIISQGLDQMVDILGVQSIPPRLILSSEVNKPMIPKTAARKRGARIQRVASPKI